MCVENQHIPFVLSFALSKSMHLLLCICAINRHGPIYILLCAGYIKIDIVYMGSLILRRGPQFSGDLGTGDPQISVVLGPGIPNSPEIWGRGFLILWVPNST